MSVWTCINNIYTQKYTHHYKLKLLF
jgi:hypothetical protein